MSGLNQLLMIILTVLSNAFIVSSSLLVKSKTLFNFSSRPPIAIPNLFIRTPIDALFFGDTLSAKEMVSYSKVKKSQNTHKSKIVAITYPPSMDYWVLITLAGDLLIWNWSMTIRLFHLSLVTIKKNSVLDSELVQVQCTADGQFIGVLIKEKRLYIIQRTNKEHNLFRVIKNKSFTKNFSPTSKSHKDAESKMRIVRGKDPSLAMLAHLKGMRLKIYHFLKSNPKNMVVENVQAFDAQEDLIGYIKGSKGDARLMLNGQENFHNEMVFPAPSSGHYTQINFITEEQASQPMHQSSLVLLINKSLLKLIRVERGEDRQIVVKPISPISAKTENTFSSSSLPYLTMVLSLSHLNIEHGTWTGHDLHLIACDPSSNNKRMLITLSKYSLSIERVLNLDSNPIVAIPSGPSLYPMLVTRSAFLMSYQMNKTFTLTTKHELELINSRLRKTFSMTVMQVIMDYLGGKPSYSKVDVKECLETVQEQPLIKYLRSASLSTLLDSVDRTDPDCVYRALTIEATRLQGQHLILPECLVGSEEDITALGAMPPESMKHFLCSSYFGFKHVLYDQGRAYTHRPSYNYQSPTILSVFPSKSTFVNDEHIRFPATPFRCRLIQPVKQIMFVRQHLLMITDELEFICLRHKLTPTTESKNEFDEGIFSSTFGVHSSKSSRSNAFEHLWDQYPCKHFWYLDSCDLIILYKVGKTAPLNIHRMSTGQLVRKVKPRRPLEILFSKAKIYTEILEERKKRESHLEHELMSGGILRVNKDEAQDADDPMNHVRVAVDQAEQWLYLLRTDLNLIERISLRDVYDLYSMGHLQDDRNSLIKSQSDVTKLKLNDSSKSGDKDGGEHKKKTFCDDSGRGKLSKSSSMTDITSQQTNKRRIPSSKRLILKRVPGSFLWNLKDTVAMAISTTKTISNLSAEKRSHEKSSNDDGKVTIETKKQPVVQSSHAILLVSKHGYLRMFQMDPVAGMDLVYISSFLCSDESFTIKQAWFLDDARQLVILEESTLENVSSQNDNNTSILKPTRRRSAGSNNGEEKKRNVMRRMTIKEWAEQVEDNNVSGYHRTSRLKKFVLEF